MAETPKSKKAPAKAAGKTETKAPAKAEAKAPAKAEAKAAPAKAKAASKPKEPRAKVKGWGRVAKGGPDNHCSVEGCKRAYRAKGWCYFHFKKWRQGELPHSRYRTCSKAECRLKAVRHGLCEKHEAEVYGKEAAAPAAAETAA
jgi:phage protein D